MNLNPSMPVDPTVIRGLKELRKVAERALERVSNSGIAQVVVNWSSLHCTETALFVTDDGQQYFRVLIEEAAPENEELQRAIRLELAADGWPNVQVDTEW